MEPDSRLTPPIPFFDRYAGTPMYRNTEAIRSELRELQDRFPLLVGLYCAPLTALSRFWTALGVLSAHTAAALDIFHRTTILASYTREAFHTKLMRQWFASNFLCYTTNFATLAAHTHLISPPLEGMFLHNPNASLDFVPLPCKDCNRIVSKLMGHCTRCFACVECCFFSLCPDMKPAAFRRLPKEFKQLFALDPRGGLPPRHDNRTLSFSPSDYIE